MVNCKCCFLVQFSQAVKFEIGDPRINKRCWAQEAVAAGITSSWTLSVRRLAEVMPLRPWKSNWKRWRRVAMRFSNPQAKQRGGTENLSQNWVSICRTPHETPIFGVKIHGFPPIFPFEPIHGICHRVFGVRKRPPLWNACRRRGSRKVWLLS